MRLFGFEVLHVEQAGDEAESAFEEYQDAGTVASTPVAVGELPWGDTEVAHGYAPGEGDEGRRVGFK